MTDLGSMTVEEALAHYGVKGMKWGKRSGDRPSASDVYAARGRLMKEARGVRSSKKAVRSAVRPETKAKRKAVYNEKKVSFLNNPDRSTALRITKGDVAVTAILATTGGLSLAATAGTVGVGSAVRVANRKVVERRQQKGDYSRVAKNRAANARTAAR